MQERVHRLRPLGRVMLVEDDLVDRIACQRLLKRLDMADELICFPDAEAAFAAMQNDVDFDVDVIFLDINMPRMDGLEFLDAIEKSKKIQFHGAVVVMISTELTSNMQTKFAQIPHVKAFIRKPLTTDELITTATAIAAAKSVIRP